MIWARLKENKCPTCNWELRPNDGDYLKCDRCSFSISASRMKEIINNLNKSTRQPYKPYRPKDENDDL